MYTMTQLGKYTFKHNLVNLNLITFNIFFQSSFSNDWQKTKNKIQATMQTKNLHTF